MSDDTRGTPGNPLLIDVVLEKLFQLMPLESLANSRLVCQRWKTLASRYYQNEYMKYDKSIRLTAGKWVDFARTFDTEQKSLFVWKKLVLDSVPLEHLFPRNLFSNYGSRITHLSLNIGNPDCISVSSFKLLLSSVINLRSLCVGSLPECISACSVKLFPVDPVTGEEFLLPKLEKLRFHLICFKYSQVFFDGMFCLAGSFRGLSLRETNSNFQLIDNILQTLGPRASEITSLKIAQLHELNLHILNMYSIQGMKLEKLALESLSQEVTHATVCELLSRQAPTLRSLLIGRPSACRSIFINFTFPFVMPNLIKLDFWTHSLEWGGIHYSRQLPRLERIIVRAYKSFHNWSVPLPNPRNIHPENRCSTVQQIVYLDENQSTENQINMWKLYLMFPCVKGICIDINDTRTFQTFWSFWSTVEDLEVRLTRRCPLPDAAFTGIPRATVNEILSYLSGDVSEEVRLIVDSQYNREGLAKLSNLRRLRVIIKPDGATASEPYYEISDILGYFIVFRLSNLEELYINSSRISQKCLDTLRRMPKMKRLQVKSLMIES